MMRSMFAGVSGLRSHQLMMDVVGNNIANVNTVGYKSSRVTFEDTLSQLIRGGSGGANGNGGINPQQVGLGVRIGATDLVFGQGASQLTGRSTDVAIQGEGFFVVDKGGERLYTRAGSFSFDNDGYLTDPSGSKVLGWTATNGAVATNAPIGDIQVKIDESSPPRATDSVQLGGNVSSAAAPGEKSSTTIELVDSLGAKHPLLFTFQNQSAAGDPATRWALTVTDPSGAVVSGPTAVAFGPDGKVSGASTATVGWNPGGGASPMSFTVDFSAMTQFGQASKPIAINQNGYEAGALRTISIADDGTISGVYSNGQSRNLARLALAAFNNPAGLVKAGENLFLPSGASGEPAITTPGSSGSGSLAAGTLEMSNVDLAQEFTNLIIAQRGFQANSRIISASDELLQDLVNLKR